MLVFTSATCFIPPGRMPPSTEGYDTARTAPFHPSIHNMGNVGGWGRAHAQGAWLATRIIDLIAYRGRNMREEVAEGMAAVRRPETDSLLEIGCGTGTLTRELTKAGFMNVTAMDTSKEMLIEAKKKTGKAGLVLGNGVDAAQYDVDVAVACMVMHELPTVAHEQVLDAMLEATEKRNGEVWVVDIDPSYVPKASMLAGEPYVPDYLLNFESTIEGRGKDVDTFSIVTGHVRGWVLRHKQGHGQ